MKRFLPKNPIGLIIITLPLTVSSLSAATHYVSLESTNPTPPYTNWVTAATSSQDAMDAGAGGDVVVVTNGVYPGGVTVTNPLTLLSVNGPQVTAVNGGGTTQCVFLSDGASLTGFTLTNGTGGVNCTSTNALLTNCVIVGNGVYWAAGGGGASGGTLYGCTPASNSAPTAGGALGSMLYNCVIVGNSAHGGYDPWSYPIP